MKSIKSLLFSLFLFSYFAPSFAMEGKPSRNIKRKKGKKGKRKKRNQVSRDKTVAQKKCVVCHAKATCMSVCSQCKVTTYCSHSCQTKDWKAHKKLCLTFKQKKEKNQHYRQATQADYELLFNAINTNKVNTVKELINNTNIDINQTNDSRYSPLYIAAQKGHTEIIKILLSCDDIDVNKAGGDGITPLLIAACKKHTAIVEKLLSCTHIDANKAAKDGITPLYAAALTGYTAIVEKLLNCAHIDVNKAHTDGTTPLHAATQQGYTKVVQLLLNCDGIDVNKTNKEDNTSLYVAVHIGHTEIVQLLLDYDGIDINKTTKKRNTLLDTAVHTGHTEIVQLLLDYDGIDVNKASKDGITPLLIAAQKGHTAVVEKLLSCNSIDVNKTYKNGITPLFIAAQKGHTAVVKKLLSCDSIDVNKANENGFTPLYVAAQEGHTKIVQLLLSHPHLNIRFKNMYGESIMHYLPYLKTSSHKELQAILANLVAKGLSINDKTNNNNTPLMNCAFHNPLVLATFIKAGANHSLENRFGRNSLHYLMINSLENGLDLSTKKAIYLIDLGLDPDKKDNFGKNAWNYASPELRKTIKQKLKKRPSGHTLKQLKELDKIQSKKHKIDLLDTKQTSLKTPQEAPVSNGYPGLENQFKAEMHRLRPQRFCKEDEHTNQDPEQPLSIQRKPMRDQQLAQTGIWLHERILNWRNNHQKNEYDNPNEYKREKYYHILPEELLKLLKLQGKHSLHYDEKTQEKQHHWELEGCMKFANPKKNPWSGKALQPGYYHITMNSNGQIYHAGFKPYNLKLPLLELSPKKTKYFELTSTKNPKKVKRKLVLYLEDNNDSHDEHTNQ